MKDYTKHSKPVSRTIDANTKASGQGSAAGIIQEYQSRAAKYASAVITPPASVQAKTGSGNGLPEPLRNGIENLSGYNLEHVNVHYNSSKPAQLQAHAYAQGSNIYLAPGKQQYLPHEAWHVVQQMQGRVRPDIQFIGMPVNLDEGLEREADLMGTRSLQNQPVSLHSPAPVGISGPGVIQGGWEDWIKLGAKAIPHIALGLIKSVPGASLVSGAIDVLNSGIGMVKEIKHRKKYFENSAITIEGTCSGVIDKPGKFKPDEHNQINGACNISLDIPEDNSITVEENKIRDETWDEKIDRVAAPGFTALGGLLGAIGAGDDLLSKPKINKEDKEHLSIHSAAGYITGNIGNSLQLLFDLISYIRSKCGNTGPEDMAAIDGQNDPEAAPAGQEAANNPDMNEEEVRDIPALIPQELSMSGSGPQTVDDQVMPDGGISGIDDRLPPSFESQTEEEDNDY